MTKTVFLGSTLPLKRGNRGYFETTSDPLENEKSKFINLILTKKGERPANPNFGCDLWKLLFEQKDGTIQDLAQQYVQDAVDAFMPYLVLQDIRILNLDTFASDQNINLYVRYGFSNNPLVSQELQLLLSSNVGGGLSVSGRTVTRDFF
jgi:phage baseplate assembly protein W